VAVKDGRLLRPPEGLVLDGREHGGRLVCVAIEGFYNPRRRHSSIGYLSPIAWRAEAAPKVGLCFTCIAP